MKKDQEDIFLKELFDKHGMEQTSSGFTDALLNRLENKEVTTTSSYRALSKKAVWGFSLGWLLLMSLALLPTSSVATTSVWFNEFVSVIPAIDWQIASIILGIVGSAFLLFILDRLILDRLSRRA